MKKVLAVILVAAVMTAVLCAAFGLSQRERTYHYAQDAGNIAPAEHTDGQTHASDPSSQRNTMTNFLPENVYNTSIY